MYVSLVVCYYILLNLLISLSRFCVKSLAFLFIISTLNLHWKDWCWSWSSNTLATWCKEPTHRKRQKAKGDDRGWDGWLAWPTQWIWVWASSGRWWRTGKPGKLQSTGSQRVRHNWATEQQQQDVLTRNKQKNKVQKRIAMHSVQFRSVAQSCPTLCDPTNRNTPGLPVHHQLPEPTQTHVHWVGDAIQQSHPLSSPSPPVLNLYQHQGLFKWVTSLHQVAKVLEFQL